MSFLQPEHVIKGPWASSLNCSLFNAVLHNGQLKLYESSQELQDRVFFEIEREFNV